MMTSKLVLATLLAFLAVCNAGPGDYNYNDGDEVKGPSHWSGTCGTENKNQSPINLVGAQRHEDLDNIIFTEYNQATSGDNFELTNTQHTAQLNIPETQQAKISGGGLDGEYTLAQLHFHWGKNDDEGSEHQINGSKYQLEVHFVHYKSSFDDLTAAVTAEGTKNLAVIGFMIEVGNDTHTGYDQITSRLDQIIWGNTTVEFPKFDLRELVPDDPGHYFRYPGSLTTPSCKETVVWTVYKDPLYISQEQMDTFRTLKYSQDDEASPQLSIGGVEGDGHNFRPIQALNDRDIFSNNPDDPLYVPPTQPDSSGAPHLLYSAMLLVAVCILRLVL